jgi:hypothetical protein
VRGDCDRRLRVRQDRGSGDRRLDSNRRGRRRATRGCFNPRRSRRVGARLGAVPVTRPHERESGDALAAAVLLADLLPTRLRHALVAAGRRIHRAVLSRWGAMPEVVGDESVRRAARVRLRALGLPDVRPDGDVVRACTIRDGRVGRRVRLGRRVRGGRGGVHRRIRRGGRARARCKEHREKRAGHGESLQAGPRKRGLQAPSTMCR